MFSKLFRVKSLRLGAALDPTTSLAIISAAEANSHAVSVGGVRIYDSL